MAFIDIADNITSRLIKLVDEEVMFMDKRATIKPEGAKGSKSFFSLIDIQDKPLLEDVQWSCGSLRGSTLIFTENVHRADRANCTLFHFTYPGTFAVQFEK